MSFYLKVKLHIYICFAEKKEKFLKMPQLKTLYMNTQRALFDSCIHKHRRSTHQTGRIVHWDGAQLCQGTSVHCTCQEAAGGRLAVWPAAHSIVTSSIALWVKSLIGRGGYSQAVTCSCVESVNGPGARKGGASKQVEHTTLTRGEVMYLRARARQYACTHTNLSV